MKKITLTLALVLMPGAIMAQVARPLMSCDGAMLIEKVSPASSDSQATEIFEVGASTTSLSQRRKACIFNLDSTAANHVWVSTFQVNNLVSGVLDTSKAVPIPGGNTEDARFCLDLGPAIRLWVFRVIGSAQVRGMICQ